MNFLDLFGNNFITNIPWRGAFFQFKTQVLDVMNSIKLFKTLSSMSGCLCSKSNSKIASGFSNQQQYNRERNLVESTLSFLNPAGKLEAIKISESISQIRCFLIALNFFIHILALFNRFRDQN